VFGQNYRGPIAIDADILFVSIRLLDKKLAMLGPGSRCGTMHIPYTEKVSSAEIKAKIIMKG